MHFAKSDTTRAPFGKNQYLRSTQDVKFESYTMSKAAMPSVLVDGDASKVLQPGTVIAKITSTAESGKVGVFQAAVADGRQTGANIVGINDTFLPWELLERDANIAVAYEATVVQAWCLEWTATPAAVALTNTTRDLMTARQDGIQLTFK